MKNWDSEIDDAAREMTRGEPDAGLKTRVLARIDEPRRIWRSPWILSPIAVAAVAVVAVMVFRTPETVPLPSQTLRAGKPDTTDVLVNTETVPGTNKTAGAPVVAGVPGLSPGEGSRTGARTRTAAPLTMTTGPAVVEDLAARAGDMESIAPAPLEIEPLATDAMEMMESIQITRLEVALLDVPLLSDPQ